MELSTLRSYIEALGGHLEISAVFDGERFPVAVRSSARAGWRLTQSTIPRRRVQSSSSMSFADRATVARRGPVATRVRESVGGATRWATVGRRWGALGRRGVVCSFTGPVCVPPGPLPGRPFVSLVAAVPWTLTA